MVMDRTLFELSERFKSTNIGPLRDLSLLSVRRIEEINKNPKCLPQDAFTKLCETYSLNKEELTMEYLQFCRNFYDIRDGIKLPTYINKNVNFDFENDELKNDEESDDKLDLNVYNDDKQNEQPHKEENNFASTQKLFKMFCIANLGSVFPILYYVLKLSVTLPVSSCSVERCFSKLKLIKTRLRTTMLQDRLEDLIRISCENDIEPDFENIIKIFAAKSTVLTKSLIY